MKTTFVLLAGRGRMMRTAGLVAGLLVSAPMHAQTDVTEQINDVRARTAIQVMLRNTQAKGVPIDALLRKVREGVAKQADAARIQAAVQSLAQRLEASHKALAPTFSVDELSAGEGALQVGVPVPTLRDLRKLSPNRPLTVPLGILTELVSHQVPVPQATKRVRELVERGANNAQLVAMGENVEADVAAGIAPDAALDLRAKGGHVITYSATRDIRILPGVPKPPIRPK